MDMLFALKKTASSKGVAAGSGLAQALHELSLLVWGSRGWNLGKRGKSFLVGFVEGVETKRNTKNWVTQGFEKDDVIKFI